jgi:hypothetical protein
MARRPAWPGSEPGSGPPGRRHQTATDIPGGTRDKHAEAAQKTALCPATISMSLPRNIRNDVIKPDTRTADAR